MADVSKTLEVAEIKGCCWLSVCFKIIFIVIKMLKIANQRRTNKEYKGRSPWSGKVVYFGANVKLISKEMNDER
jgi:hypothetical protein